ncbi:dynein light intermediate chain [Cyclospora cayetanensis]|uniref:Dynein light intermediate chain n=1 Tax=Cyclospora cayetanensis TaxID=88456 RepID=A0A1D3D188_9EIME|nr:dynein light intermediate chain [Cyclospora cayetanensis]
MSMPYLFQIGSPAPLSETELLSDTGGVAELDFAYLGVRCLFEEEEEAAADVETKANVWILQDPYAWESVAARLPPSCLPHLSILVCLDLLQAWGALSALRAWLRVADKIVQRLMQQQTPEDQKQINNKMLSYISTYRANCLHHFLSRGPTDAKIENIDEAPPSVAALQGSAGAASAVPVTVVVTRSDAASSLTTRENPSALEIFLLFLRFACMNAGAALFLTSCKQESRPLNVYLLYRYMMHRIYGYPFRESAQLEEAERLFVPAGWDTEAELRSLIAKTPAESFDSSTSPAYNPRVPLQKMAAFLGELQQRHPSAIVAMKSPAATQQAASQKVPLGDAAGPPQQAQRRTSKEVRLNLPADAASGDAETLGSVPALSVGAPQGGPEARVLPSRALGQSASRALGSVRGAPLQKGSVALTSGSVRSVEGLDNPADSDSLQNFFQGLMAKTRGKAPATPRERAKPVGLPLLLPLSLD